MGAVGAGLHTERQVGCWTHCSAGRGLLCGISGPEGVADHGWHTRMQSPRTPSWLRSTPHRGPITPTDDSTRNINMGTGKSWGRSRFGFETWKAEACIEMFCLVRHSAKSSDS